MAQELTLIIPAVQVLEVRRGLFRVHWSLECREQMADPLKNTVSFQLCGSQSSHRYTMSCDVQSNSINRAAAVNNKEKSDYFYGPFGVNFKLSENTPSQQNVRNSSVPPNTLKAKSYPQRPNHVWISKNATFNSNEVHLHESDSGTWVRKFTLWSEQPTFITLWIDFGITTPGVKNVICGLAELFDNQDRCDVQFQFPDGQKIGAHVLILSIGSPIFAAMFQSGFKETQTRDVAISEIELEVFRQLLVYLYTGNAPKLREENITQSLFEAADKYDVKTLREECTDALLLRQLTVKNAINTLIWSHLHSVPKVFDSALKFVAENGKQIFVLPEWFDLITNHPKLCLTVTQHIAGLVSIMYTKGVISTTRTSGGIRLVRQST